MKFTPPVLSSGAYVERNVLASALWFHYASSASYIVTCDFSQILCGGVVVTASLSVRLSVRLSVCLSVCQPPTHLQSNKLIPMRLFSTRKNGNP